jgi:galactose mutarotase-like enzyme
MVYVMAPPASPGEHSDFFCLEPMTHRVGGHELGDGGLVTLLLGESVSGSINFTLGKLSGPERMPSR